jgi:DNA invertase Pin-like site-specific DNA recombinase
MITILNPPLEPGSGGILRVLAPGRVSCPRPGKQDMRSLDDQQDIQRRWLEQHTDLPVEVEVIAGSGSGEILDRAEFLRLLDLIRSGKYDLVLTEDLGRIVRRVHAFYVCELCEDHGVRLIAINNHGVDTAQPGWREAAFFASFFYERDNHDKSLRIKERLRSRFLAGAAIPGPIFGIVKSPGAKSDADLQKDPKAEPIYREWFRMLDEDGTSFSAIADWLNSKDVPVGGSCWKKEKWDCQLVGKTTRNPLLKGVRVHNERQSRRINATGKYKSEKAPSDRRLVREVPHLAFFEAAYYDRVVAAVNKRNAKYSRTEDGQADPLVNRAKKRTRFPGQMIECGICGRGFVFGGHGQRDHLMCDGARAYRCWNGITVDGPLAAERISNAVFHELAALEGFDAAFLLEVEEQAKLADEGRQAKLHSLTTSITRNERELSNVLAFIRNGTNSSTLRAELEKLEREKSQLAFSLNELESQPRNDIILPTVDELRELARAAFHDLTHDSFEFAQLMRRLIPKIVVWPHRLCDGGKIVLRSRFQLHLSAFVQNRATREVLQKPLERELTVDLFEPCQRVRFRDQVVRLRATVNPATGKKHSAAEAARDVGITVTAAQAAAKLQRKMDELGVSDPYVPVTEPPDDFPKLRRHKHSRYSFEPLARIC